MSNQPSITPPVIPASPTLFVGEKFVKLACDIATRLDSDTSNCIDELVEFILNEFFYRCELKYTETVEALKASLKQIIVHYIDINSFLMYSAISYRLQYNTFCDICNDVTLLGNCDVSHILLNEVSYDIHTNQCRYTNPNIRGKMSADIHFKIHLISVSYIALFYILNIKKDRRFPHRYVKMYNSYEEIHQNFSDKKKIIFKNGVPTENMPFNTDINSNEHRRFILFANFSNIFCIFTNFNTKSSMFIRSIVNTMVDGYMCGSYSAGGNKSNRIIRRILYLEIVLKLPVKMPKTKQLPDRLKNSAIIALLSMRKNHLQNINQISEANSNDQLEVVKPDINNTTMAVIANYDIISLPDSECDGIINSSNITQNYYDIISISDDE